MYENMTDDDLSTTGSEIDIADRGKSHSMSVFQRVQEIPDMKSIVFFVKVTGLLFY